MSASKLLIRENWSWFFGWRCGQYLLSFVAFALPQLYMKVSNFTFCTGSPDKISPFLKIRLINKVYSIFVSKRYFQTCMGLCTDLGSLIGNFNCGYSTVWKFCHFSCIVIYTWNQFWGDYRKWKTAD